MSADLLRLARLGARMRWTITRNSLRRRGRALFVLTLVASSIGAMAGFVTFAGSALMDPDPRRAVLLFGFTMALVAWMSDSSTGTCTAGSNTWMMCPPA